MKKDTIYIDIEDDITSIIDKVKSAKANIVALVPPKRSTTLNSAVNMKLLLKSAEEAGRRVVLVTSDESLTGLAGGVGLYVAQNLHSKPAVPDAIAAPISDESVIDGSELDPTAPVGELDQAHTATVGAKEGKPPVKAAAAPKRGFKIPSFDRFRGRLFLIAGGIILLGLVWWWAFWIAPKAIIAIDAQTTAVDTAFEFTADSTLTEDDYDKNLFAAQQVEIKKTVTEQFTPTGKKNIGDKATGSMTVQNCDSSDSFTLPAGTIATSPAGLKFEFLEEAAVPGGSFSGGGCSSPGEATVNVRAVAPGADYNLAAGTEYDIDGVGSLVVGNGGQMSGGTDKNVTVIAQKDVDAAKKKLLETDRQEEISELRQKLDDSMVPVNETYQIKLGSVTALPSVGQEAETGSVTAEATLTLLALKKDTLNQALDDFLEAKIEGGDQVVYQNGSDQLVFTLLDGPAGGKADLRLTTTGYIGPDLNTEQLAEEIKGKRYSETVNYIKSRPGVVEVDVNFEPFWVFSAPRPGRIEFVLNVSGNPS